MKTKIGFVNLLMASVLAFTAILGGVMPQQVVQAYTTDSLIFINEIHYDNVGTDVNEAIEIAGPAGTDLSGWKIVLYNGSGGAVYNTTTLDEVLNDFGNGYGFVHVAYPVNGIQNGAPDGIALVKPDDTVVQFLSYEGTFTAVGGPADGLLSTDIGVSEPSDSPVGYSLQLSGKGNSYDDFTWQSPATATPGAVNNNQVFENGSILEPKINEFVANHVGTDTNEYIEIYGEPETDYSLLTILEIEGDDTSQGVIDEVIQVGTTNSEGFWVTNFLNNAIENGTLTLLLVKNFSGTLGNDLDTDNDGILDVTPWDEIIDAVAVFDGGSLDITYGLPVLTSDFDDQSFTVGGASRIPDGTDTEATSDWVRNDFDLAGIPGFTGTITLGEAYNTPGLPNMIYETPPPPPEQCGDPYTTISSIQGTGLESPLNGSLVSTEGVVTASFDGKNGFFIQDPVGDGKPESSEGIFIYLSGFTLPPEFSNWDSVRVRGSVSEFNGLTEITITQLWICKDIDPENSTEPIETVAPTEITLPVTTVDDFEKYEGMLVTLPQALTISEYFNYDRYGEIVLTTERYLTFTAEYEPSVLDYLDAVEEFKRNRIIIDDGRTAQNPDPAIHPNGSIFDLGNLFRGGDSVANITGIMDYGFSEYRIQPVQGADYYNTNPRPMEPEDVGGDIKVASFNVLNYFTTIDTDGKGPWICGPLQDMECRGADTEEEFARQKAKIIAALTTMDADVVGLMEIENHIDDTAVKDLVDGLNGFLLLENPDSDTYAYVATGPTGSDAIKVAMIYKPDRVTPYGGYAILDSSVDSRFDDTKNRPTLAQSFQDNTNGGVFTVAVNHLKSKGSDCNDVGDPDLGDGAGNCNLTRKYAAEAMVDWLATDPTGSGSNNYLIIGDLNSYDKEDPIDAILAGTDAVFGAEDDYTDLLFHYIGEDAYTYVFDGQIGYLDHALANPDLFSMVTGTTVWHINADEPDLIDYDMSFKLPAQDALYAPDPFRSSDHDPVIVGLKVCELVPPSVEVTVTPDQLWPPNHKYVDVVATVTARDNFDPDPQITLVSVTSNEPDNGEDDGNTIVDIVTVDKFTFKLRAERSDSGTGRIYTITYLVTDACGNTTYQTALVYVPISMSK